MDHVSFLIEETGQRIECLLNPEHLIVRRQAGIQPRQSAAGQFGGVKMSDSPLLYTGGGRTELDMRLLFDVTLAGLAEPVTDVRTMTAPLWRLAENTTNSQGYAHPPVVRIVWGKALNMAGLITAIAERLEYFTTDGTPQRSWLTMQMVRVSVDPEDLNPPLPPLTASTESLEGGSEEASELLAGDVTPHQVIDGERLEEIAAQQYGDPSYWRLLASLNGVENPLELETGQPLLLPSRENVLRWLSRARATATE
jgi:hypothetical protein